jgi:hypothetical protein
MLNRYWIVFEKGSDPIFGLTFGVGVTAFDVGDARKLIGEQMKIDTLPSISKVTYNVKYADLEENHVKRNMGDMSRRGVWYPNVNQY